MKRGAENQLTKDSMSDDEEAQETSGFHKADQNVLASRPMRGLPKRSTAAMSASAPTIGGFNQNEGSQQLPKFGGFSGFGTSSATAASFKPPIATAATPATVSSTASNTAKTFASFLGSGPTTSSTTQHLPSSSTPATSTHKDDPAALNYYTSLRGLNVSVLSTLSKATEEDPFKDITAVLEQYKNFRAQIQRDYDAQKQAPEQPAAASKPAFSMPSVPSGGFSFAGVPVSSSSTSSLSHASGGFTPKPTSSPAPSPFTLPTSASVPSSAPKSAFSFSTPPASQGPAASNPFGFPSAGTTNSLSTPSLFGASTSSTSLFGNSNIAPSSGPLPVSFGATTSVSTTTTSPFGAPSTASSGFTFGASDGSKLTPGALGAFRSTTTEPAKPAAATSSPPKGSFAGFGGFGKPSPGGSLGNPVGFGFGTSARTPEVESTTSAAASGSEDNGGESGEAAAGNAKTESFSFLGNNPHDEEGEGEEDEETTHSVKLKVYRLKKADDKEGTGWKELGYGVLRLKRHKETGKRRMLLRNSSTGKIHINFNLYSGMKPPAQTKKSLTFMGFEGTTPQNYNVRLQSEEKATELKAAIENEVAEIP